MADKFRILVADKLAEEGVDFLRSQPDCDVVSKPGLSEDELAQIVGEYDGMIVRSGVQVSAKVMENPGRLKVVARAGVGVDNIDLQAATNKGILVVNSAEASTTTTAEHAFALLMALARQIGPAYKAMTEGRWDRGKFQGRQLSGKTLAVIGFGRIGRTVAERGLAFGMNVIAFDPVFNAPTAMDGKVKMFTSFEDVLPEADILTFHVPLNDQTRGLLNEQTFAKCRKGVLVVNAARGGVVDEDALVAALESGQCGGAALDVYVDEPPPADSPLRSQPNLLVTPHLGASTIEAQTAVSVDAATSALSYLRGEGIHGAVNVAGLRLDLDELQTHFVDLAQRMATLISPMITRGFAEITFEIAGESVAPAAGTVERVALVNLLQAHIESPLNVVNVRHLAEQRGIDLRVVTRDDSKTGAPALTIEIVGPKGAVDENTLPPDRDRRIVGRVYQDLRPRIVEVNRYHMDMVPAGTMVLIQNEDRPGMVGLVGSRFGEGGVNIADMAISRREHTALMVLKVDEPPSEDLVAKLKATPGILKLAVVTLPAEP